MQPTPAPKDVLPGTSLPMDTTPSARRPAPPPPPPSPPAMHVHDQYVPFPAIVFGTAGTGGRRPAAR